MDVNKWLDFIEQFKDIGIVKFFSRFYSESFLSPYVKSVSDAVINDTPRETAKDLLLWAALLMVLVFLVDQVVYWTQPGQIAHARVRYARGVHNVVTAGPRFRAWLGKRKGKQGRLPGR